MTGGPAGSAIEIAIAEDALARLAERAAREGWERALVVMDANTREAAGEDVVAALAAAGTAARTLIFEQRSGLPAGPEQAERVRRALTAGSRPVAVGSGVITDIVRFASHQQDVDFVSVATAASMDGYASGVAAMQLGGVKVTYPARPPLAVFADPRVAARAPAVLTRSGLGDLLAKATARVDWIAAHELYGEPFSGAVAQRVLAPLTFAAANVEAVLGGGTGAIASLLDGLVQSGLAMAEVGSSRPASGCEHHASHFWDLLAARGLRAHAPHGLQAGYATRFAMRLQRFAFGGAIGVLRRPRPAADPLGAPAREWLGEPTQEIRAAVSEKQRLHAQLPPSWPAGGEQWEAVRARISPAIGAFDAVDEALERAGIPAEPGYLGVDARTLRATFRYATRLRARYTTVDFLEGQGALDRAIAACLPVPQWSVS